MRLLRSLIFVLFVLVCAAAVWFCFTVKPDSTKPTVSCAVSQIDAPCSVTEKELLKYASASDSKDGDLTDSVFVESISPFIKEGVSVVTFCVGDSDGNVAKKAVRLNYTDYEKPNLVLHSGLVFQKGTSPNFLGAATVTDKFDGDITERLYTLVSDSSDDDSPQGEVLFKVTNSKGYTYEWKFKFMYADSDYFATPYKISLKSNSLFVTRGEKKPDFKKLVEKITSAEKEYNKGTLVIDDSALNMKKSGTYDVWYRLYSPGKKKDRKLIASERLIVVCEESAKEENNK